MSRPQLAPLVTAIASIVGVMTQTQMLELERLLPVRSTSLVRVAADPVTGRLAAPEYASRPMTIDEMIALAHDEARGLVTLHNADGSETINHEGRFADHLIVRLGADGKPRFVCVQGQAAAARALRSPTVPTPGAEDR